MPAPAPLHGDTIQRRKLYQEVADRLQALILSGALQVGEQLPSERDLMERFGVGRPAVREALFALERAGLIAVSGGERARVVRPTPEGILTGLDATARHWLSEPQGVAHLQQARGLFEVALARQAAETRDQADLARLRAALDANEQALGMPGAFEQTDVAFHYVIAGIGGNPIYTALHQAMLGWLVEQRSTSLRSPGAAARALAGHREVFTAVQAGDGATAATAMRRHLDEVAELYWSAKGRSDAR